jgi:hypothetical protein
MTKIQIITSRETCMVCGGVRDGDTCYVLSDKRTPGGLDICGDLHQFHTESRVVAVPFNHLLKEGETVISIITE